MWCRNCNIETKEETCPICGVETSEDIPTEIMWCKVCRVPVIREVTQSNKSKCPLCGNRMKYLAKKTALDGMVDHSLFP